VKLYQAERHAPDAAVPWDPAEARSAIAEIAEEALAAFDAEAFWPAHPLDEGFRDGSTTLYAGAAGVIWALRHLGCTADFRAVLPRLVEKNRREYASFSAYPQHGSLLMGEVGVLLLAARLAPSSASAERLRELTEASLALPPMELMWGMPGTMLAALFMAEMTRDARWQSAFRRQARRLLGELQDTQFGPLWIQELYGSVAAHLGPVHGFAGHMVPLLRGWEWLDAAERKRTESAARRTLAANARESENGVNWHALAGEQGAPYLVQYCHGAPGIVTTFADSPFATPDLDRLLLGAGELIRRAGPLRKGSGLCHGTAGNGYALLKLHRRFHDAVWLDRARAFAMSAIAQCREARHRFGRGRYSLWTGDLGLAVYLHDCLRGEPRFPTIDVF